MITKDCTKTGRSCRVTFALPTAVQAQHATLLGEFNDWSAETHR